jgi:hypothetical protein
VGTPGRGDVTAVRAARAPATLEGILRDHPGTELWCLLPAGRAGPMFCGALVLRGERREVAQNSPEMLAEALGRRAAEDAAIGEVEAEFPGWRVWRSPSRRWWATRTGSGAQYDSAGVPMTVDADTRAALKARLAGYREVSEHG